MGTRYVNGQSAEISDRYIRRKVSHLSEQMANKVYYDLDLAFRMATYELAEESPRDYTTPEMRKQARSNGEVIPFVKHGQRSADAYTSTIVKSRTGKTITGKILNDYVYVLYLDKGLMDRTGLLLGARIKERDGTGRYSEQQPNGGFINRALKRTLIKYGYNIDKSKFETKLI